VVFRFLTYIYIWVNSRSRHGSVTRPPNREPLWQYHLFVIFAVLDVSFTINSCLNRGFLTFIFAVLLHFCSYYVIQGMVPGQNNFWGAPIDQPAATKFGIKAVIVTYSPNPSCVPNLKLLASTVVEISTGSQFFWMLPWHRRPAILVLNVVS